MRRVLLVANQTSGGPTLVERVRARHEQDETAFTLLVPASDAHIGDRLTYDEQQAWREAEQRLAAALGRLRACGARVDGNVGAHDAFDATMDAVRDGGPYDEIIVSTFPPGLSRWLGLDLVSRLRAALPGIEVTHILGRAGE